MSKPPVLGRQLDRCDICGKETHKINLVRTNVDFLSVTGNNYFPYSSYNSSGWTLVTGTDAGTISTGPYADECRIVTDDDNNSTESFGSQTWTVGAGFGVYSGHVQIKTASAIDISDWTSLVVAYDFGFYDQETSVANLTPAALIYNSDGSGGTSINTRLQWKTGGRYWGTINISDVASGLDTENAVFHIDLRTHTGSEKVWIDRMQLIKNATSLRNEAFIPTSGSSVDQTDARAMTMRKVCKRCYEPLLSRTEQYNRRPEQRTDEPITVWNQEF